MLFPPGRIVITDGATAVLSAADAVRFVRRHLTGDFGEMDAHDRAVNREQMKHGGRVHSQYTLGSGQRIWIITDPGRAVTTILLPEEY